MPERDFRGFPCECGASFCGPVWHCRCGWHMNDRRPSCWQCGLSVEDGAVYPYTAKVAAWWAS